jgi:hypothetical protein
MKEFFVFDDEKTHMYTLQVTKDKKQNNVFTLRTSSESGWFANYKNVALLSITDTGNGLIFDKSYLKNKEFSYSKTIALKILLEFMTKYDKEMSYDIVEIGDTIKI